MPGGEDQFDRLHVLSPEFSGKRKTDRFSPRKLGDNKAPAFLRIPVADNLDELRTTEGQIAYVTGDGADDQGLYFRTDTDWTEAGGDPGAPPDASYVVLSSDPDLSNESTHASLTGADLHDPATHGSTHQDGGADEINVAGLSGDLADPQDPKTHGSTHSNGGADELTVENLGTGGAAGTVPTSTGTGGLSMSAVSGDATSEAVRTSLSSSVVQPSGSRLKLPFDVKAYDTGNNFDTTTHNYTCPKDGVYVAHLTVQMRNGGSSDKVTLRISKGSSAGSVNKGTLSEVTFANVSFSYIVPISSFSLYTAGDTIAFYVRNNTSSFKLDPGPENFRTHAEIVYLGDP